MASGASDHFDAGKHPKHRIAGRRLGLLVAGLVLGSCAAAPVCPFDRPPIGPEGDEQFLRLSREEMASCLVAWEPERFVKGVPRAYRGKAVDAETGEPIAGAVVIAVWDREWTGAGGRVPEFYDAREVLTDESGEFVLDASNIEGSAPYNTRWPIFRIYKPGYGFYPRYHVSPKVIPRHAFREEFTVVQLRKSRSNEERMRNLSVLTHAPIEKQSNLLKAIDIERRGLGLSP